jgi:hypothetical protein
LLCNHYFSRSFSSSLAEILYSVNTNSPSPLPSPWHPSSTFCFYEFYSCQLPQISEIMKYLPFCICLISPRVLHFIKVHPSYSIYQNSTFHFSLGLNNILLHTHFIYIYICYIGVVSTLAVMHSAAMNKDIQIHPSVTLWFQSCGGKNPEVGLLDHMVILCLALCGIIMLFSRAAVYIVTF